MKYTKSNDGKMRTTIRLDCSLRLTQEELEKYNQMARELGYTDFRQYANRCRPQYEMMLQDDYQTNNGI